MKFMKLFLGLLMLTILAAAAVLLVIYSGIYDVSATAPHLPATDWLLQTTKVHSVEARARSVEPPADLSDPARARRGAGRFAVLCSGCHGAPGIEPSEIGRGLTPAPPSLGEVASAWSAQELFWIVEHGVKFTGMPAFGPTQSEERLWDIVALVQKLPGMSAEEYRDLGMP